jgi:zinc protease
MADEGPTSDELARVLAQAEAQFVYRLQTVGGFGGKSDQLNAYNTFLGDPDFFPRDLERYLSVTTTAAGAAAAQYLQSAPRVSLSVVPQGRESLALADSEPAMVH